MSNHTYTRDRREARAIKRGALDAYADRIVAQDRGFTRYGLLGLIIEQDGWGAQSVEADRILLAAHDRKLSAWKIGGAL